MASQDYLDFELSIELLGAAPNATGGEQLRVRVVNSPVGSVETTVPNTLTDAEIAQIIGILDGTINANRADRAKFARSFGEKLFNLVFSNQIFAAYLTSQQQAGDAGLRLKLSLEDAGRLNDLPWELLRDPRTDYLVLSRQTPVIRFPQLLTLKPLVEVSLPLRVLVLISGPVDQATLDVEGEWNALQEATADLRARGLLEIERLDNAQLITLQRKLRSGVTYHVFHYIGHSAFDERSQTGMLAFEDPRQRTTVPVSGEALARELSEENGIRLVVLNACQGARQDLKDPFSGIASSIVARGIPAVVAMQFAITDEASRIFSQEFYRVLSESYPIEAALAESRRAISSTLSNLEWVTPVLYLRAPTGYLFPKRRPTASRASVGGLRELLQHYVPVIIGAIVILLVGLGFIIARLPGGTTPTATPVPTIDPNRDVDLVVTELRFFPPNPAPGELVSVSLDIKNNGTTDSGPFKWAWYSSINAPPALTGQFTNLNAKLTVTVGGKYIFPGWGSYESVAWVNFDDSAQEKNTLNNILGRHLITTLEPLVLDFVNWPDGTQTSLKPDGTQTNSVNLTGNEYSPWGVQIQPQPKPTDPTCAKAIPILVGGDTPQLVTGLPDDSQKCTNLPILLSLGQPSGETPIGAVSVDFIPTVAGTYSLDLFSRQGVMLKNGAPITVTGDDVSSGQTKTLTVSGNTLNLSLTNTKALFHGPDAAITSIQRILLQAFVTPQPSNTPSPTP